tara:strand:+ start:224 stop:403 length:180 start_codon:yes stop_codon:yes gene_type:complete
MNRELDRFVILIISLVTFVLLSPFVLVIAVIKFTKSTLTIAENTLRFFVDSIRKELLKQ